MSRAGALARAACAALLLGGCGLVGGAPADYAPSAGPYDRLPEPEVQRVVRARELTAEGELERARAVLAEVLRRRPQNIAVGSFLQDIDLRLAADGSGEHPSADELARAALDRARREPSPARLLLAARIAPDPDLARGLMDEALELDPACAWAHYAVAWSLAKESRWGEAEERLQQALAIDPGHLPARRLEAGMIARGGKPEDAVEAFERWLRVSAGQPLVDPAERLGALLDLAQLHLLAGQGRRARELLVSIADEAPSSARRGCILAATEHDQGRDARALAAAREAAEDDPTDALPLVQQALLLEGSFGDPAGARQAWEAVLELSRRDSDLAALILGMRARVALERSAPAAAEDGTSAPTP